MNVFTGKMYLKFERFSDYVSGGRYPGFKVKTILNLGFTKLVLRIRATGYTNRALEMAQMAFPYVSESATSEKGLGFNRMYCYNDKHELMGALEDFRHLFKHDLVCFEGCPKGVIYARNLDKYIGYTHRGMAEFGIGDKLFDPTWRPTWDDLDIEWVKSYCRYVGYGKIPQSITEAKTFVKLLDIPTGQEIVEYIPFTRRGSKVIETKQEAIQAAKNLSLYLS